MGFGSFLKNQMASTDLCPSAPCVAPNTAPTERQIYQNRLNKGVNLGSMFVLEKWITPHMFPEGEDHGKTSEFDAIEAALHEFKGDKKKVREKWEEHWSTWITDDDWNFLKSVGVTSVRLPIGYWNVDNGAFVEGTHFDGLEKIYKNSWSYITAVIEKAKSYQIGVLIDLHAVPGGANSADHSGISTAKGELWDSSKNQIRTFKILEKLAIDLKQYDNVVGLQVLNEAPYNDDWETQRTFYLKALNKVREVNDEIPVIISDGWDANAWTEWAKSKEGQLALEQDKPSTLGLILDEHVYRTFSDKDRSTHPAQIVSEIGNALPDTGGEVDIMVGEFSCVMDGNSWSLNDRDPKGSREEIVHEFGNRECQHFNERACAYYFWTYKFKYGRGGEWDFREMQEKGCLDTGFKSMSQLYPSDRHADDNYYNEQYHQMLQQRLGAHMGYWNSQDPNRDWQHWRFEDGFKVGWLDSLAFDKFNHSQIGRKAAWRKTREQQHVAERGGQGELWVFGQGFNQGVEAFLQARDSFYH